MAKKIRHVFFSKGKTRTQFHKTFSDARTHQKKVGGFIFMGKAKSRWIRKNSVKVHSKTGRSRKVGFRNLTDKTAKRLGRKRVKGFVDNPDTSKKGQLRKNYRKNRSFF